MFEQRQVDWFGVFVAVLLMVAGAGITVYAVVVFIVLSPTNFGGYGLYIFVGLTGIGGLGLTGCGVKFVALSIAGKGLA